MMVNPAWIIFLSVSVTIKYMNIYVYMYSLWYVRMLVRLYSIRVKVRRQLAGVCSFLPPCGFWGSNVDHLPWQQALLLTEPYC